MSTLFPMEYRLLGKTGLNLSVLGLGALTFDTVERAIDLLSTAREYGINFFDNAEAYGNPYRGISEVNFGKALKILQERDPILWRRSELIITTKIFLGPQQSQVLLGLDRSKIGVNEMGLSRKHLMEGVNDSLSRMQLKYVDIVYSHRFDELTSIENIVQSFTDIIKSGKAFFWGTSMWKTSQIIEAHWIARVHGLIAPVIEQPIYSMFDREVVEYSYLDIFKKPYFTGISTWNALDRGVLAGKYVGSIPKEGRLVGSNRLGIFVSHMKHVTKEKNEKVCELMEIANELHISMAALAIAWLIKNPNVTTCILGCTKVKQLKENIDGVRVANMLDEKVLERIESILDNKPKLQVLDIIHRKISKRFIKARL